MFFLFSFHCLDLIQKNLKIDGNFQKKSLLNILFFSLLCWERKKAEIILF